MVAQGFGYEGFMLESIQRLDYAPVPLNEHTGPFPIARFPLSLPSIFPNCLPLARHRPEQVPAALRERSEIAILYREHPA